jgi:hypothetical protein
MFLDEKRSGEPQQLSVAGFAAFVATKDPAEEYVWNDASACACAQYAHSIGKYEEWLGPPTDVEYWMWNRLDKIARPGLGDAITFGELAQKLEPHCQQS